MTVFVYLICWTQSGGLAKYGMSKDTQSRKDWERWARSQYRNELRSWGKWSRAYSVPMRTAREAKDWEFLMGKIANMKTTNFSSSYPGTRDKIGEIVN